MPVTEEVAAVGTEPRPTTQPATPAPEHYAPRHAAKPTTLRAAWIPLTALCLAFFVEMVDNTVLTIALPTMGRDLHASTTQLQWVTGAYSLVFGSLLLLAGTVADRYGRRRVLMTGLATFGIVSAFVWFVDSANQLITLRSILGVAAACMAPVTMSLVFRLFEDEGARMRAITLMVSIGMGAMALGPVLAGTVLNSFSWKWLLFANTPIALLAVIGVMLGVPKDTADDLHPDPLDIPGALLTMAFMAFGCYSFTAGVDRGWGNWVTISCMVLAVLAAIGFVFRERAAKHPMIDIELLTHRTVRGSALAQLAGAVAQMAAMWMLIMHFQYANGWSPMRAGFANLPFVLTMMLASPVTDGLTKRFGHRVTTAIAIVLIAGSMVGMAFAMGARYWVLAITIVGMTLGLRIVMTVCAVALIDSVPEDRTSLGTALNDVTQELGSSIGVALVGTVIAALVAKVLPDGAWTAAFHASFIHGERVALIVTAALVALIGGYGASTLTNSHAVEEH